MNYLKRFGTRERTILTAIIFGFALFLYTNPFIKLIGNYILPPGQPVNIEVTKNAEGLNLKWEAPPESDDVKEYIINYTLEDVTTSFVTAENAYTFIETGQRSMYQFELISVDTYGKTSSPAKISIDTQIEELPIVFRQHDSYVYSATTSIIFSLLVCIVLAILTTWVLFFKIDFLGILTISIFPSISLFPFLIFSFTYLSSLNAFITKFIFSSGVVFLGGILAYFLILTSNILNGTRQKKLPLEQAAKAAHFIFSLISVYLSVIYVYAASYNIIAKIIIVSLFVMYFSFSACYFVADTKKTYRSLVKGLAITLTLAISILILSVWPIISTYTVLSVAIIYYVLLNIALETRQILSKYIYIEFLILLLLVFVILGTSASWGIIGPLF